MKAVAQAVQNLSQDALKQLEKGQAVDVEIQTGEGAETITLQPDEVIINAKEIKGWKIASEGGQTVALDITLTPELIKEGRARELVNRIQNIRKNSGLEVTDRIRIFISPSPEIEETIREKGDYVKAETLAEEIVLTEETGEGIQADINGIPVTIRIEKI
ncbi:MAG: hypothetical protein GXO27_06085 [Chlorobi bacterium]|nr:hypothetical protein [Chlorobiota bacterium]